MGERRNRLFVVDGDCTSIKVIQRIVKSLSTHDKLLACARIDRRVFDTLRFDNDVQKDNAQCMYITIANKHAADVALLTSCGFLLSKMDNYSDWEVVFVSNDTIFKSAVCVLSSIWSEIDYAWYDSIEVTEILT